MLQDRRVCKLVTAHTELQPSQVVEVSAQIACFKAKTEKSDQVQVRRRLPRLMSLRRASCVLRCAGAWTRVHQKEDLSEGTREIIACGVKR